MATRATDMDTLKQALYEAFNKANELADQTRTDSIDGRKTVAELRSSAAHTAGVIVAIEQGRGPAVRK